MEAFRAAMLAACMMSCAAGLIRLVTPEKTLARQIRFLLSMLFALGLAVPLLHARLPAGFGTEEMTFFTETMQEKLHEQLLAETKTRLESVLREALRARGITCETVEVTLHIDENGCIHISKAQVTCDDFAAANAVLPDLLGGEGDYEVTQILGAPAGE